MQIEVVLKPPEISIVVNMRPILRGKLFANIKEEESTWYLDGRILVLLLLKSNRRGHYKNGCTNAATFWQSVLSKPAPNESLLVRTCSIFLKERCAGAHFYCCMLNLNIPAVRLSLTWKAL